MARDNYPQATGRPWSWWAASDDDPEGEAIIVGPDPDGGMRDIATVQLRNAALITDAVNAFGRDLPGAQCDGYAGDPGASAPRCEKYRGHPGPHRIFLDLSARGGQR